MVAPALFSSAKTSGTDLWGTPRKKYDELDAEFHFVLDAAANRDNALCVCFIGEDQDALRADWAEVLAKNGLKGAVFLNPPYSRLKEFIRRARWMSIFRRLTVVLLIPSRTDTKVWHRHIWNKRQHRPRKGVEVRLLEGRLKFGGSRNAAPFPSAVVIFRPPNEVKQ